jgi:hypothetical protein
MKMGGGGGRRVMIGYEKEMSLKKVKIKKVLRKEKLVVNLEQNFPRVGAGSIYRGYDLVF